MEEKTLANLVNTSKKFIFIIFFSLLFLSFSGSVYAETKRDCSQYSTSSLMGILDKKRCEKGKPPREALGKKLKKLNPFKKKN